MNVALRPALPIQPYDPQYDPLVDATPGCNRDYAPTYWIATAGMPPEDDGPVRSDLDADVVIVGSGFTGLTCALFLAREFGIKATVLEANRVAWGCKHPQRCAGPGGTRPRSGDCHWRLHPSQSLHARLRSRVMPILSNSLVTRPLTDAEIEATRFRTHQVITDTRVLRHYYHLLPDRRLQIGSRSAITGADAANPIHLRRLVDGMHAKFPALRGIEVDYAWWGWVDVSHDMMPRIVQPDPAEPLFYAVGYGGNGVSYSAQAGRRLAELVVGRPARHAVPIFRGELPGHAFAPFRRLGQRMLYQLYANRDERADR